VAGTFLLQSPRAVSNATCTLGANSWKPQMVKSPSISSSTPAQMWGYRVQVRALDACERSAAEHLNRLHVSDAVWIALVL
jgi:hypothetical protein